MALAHGLSITSSVALLAEGVDRNFATRASSATARASPSSRRAWIEIPTPYCRRSGASVALLAEGVDRNSWGISRTAAALGRPPRGGRG